MKLTEIEQELAAYDETKQSYWQWIDEQEPGPIHWKHEHNPHKDKLATYEKTLNAFAPDALRSLLAVAKVSVEIARLMDEQEITMASNVAIRTRRKLDEALKAVEE